MPERRRLTAALGDRYAIERELGAGGMATVYLALDRKHDRRVAVKVLHPELAAALGGERFLSEIKTTANLQHPHILPLHDSGEANGFLYYVMPFVDGESLRTRLSREKQLALEDAVRIGRQVADALAHAHGRGVVHRDIKPENILLQGAHAVVADFGIALAVQEAGGHRLTQTGLTLGTPQYMAPEQALAERVIDHRADIHALGAVMYEMLTGEPPFNGSTTRAIMAKVMTERPTPPSTVRDTVPIHVERAVMKALCKLPADRFASAKEFGAALEHPAAGSQSTAGEGRVGVLGSRLSAAALAVLMLAVGWAAGQWRGSNGQGLVPSTLTLHAPLMEGSARGGTTMRRIALSPDGSAVVYRSSGAAGNFPVLHRLDATEPMVLRSSLAVGSPLAVFDDGTIVVSQPVAAGGRLTWVSPTGGPISTGPRINQGFLAPHPDGSLWVTRPPFDALERIPRGGRGDSIEVRFSGVSGVRLYQILDNGRTAIVIQLGAGKSAGPCYLMDLRTGVRTRLFDTPVREVRYTAGHLVYMTEASTLHAVPFDVRRNEIVGAHVQIATGVSYGGPGVGDFAVSRNGTVAYIPVDEPSLVFVDRAGAVRLAHPAAHSYHGPRFSPDGSRIAVDFSGVDGRNVWILDMSQSTLSRVTFEGNGHDPTWTPDGTHISYLVARDTVHEVYLARASGTGAPERLFATASTVAFTGLWTRNPLALLPVLGAATGDDIAIVPNGGRDSMRLLVATPYQERAAAPSPDGRWLAFVSNQSGRFEVYIRGLTTDAEQIQVSQDGGDEPVWSRDGRELFYRGPEGASVYLMVATIETTPSPRVTGRRSLFSVSGMAQSQPHANYDITPDGKTFVMVQLNSARRIIVIQNLPELVQSLRRYQQPTR